MVKLSTAFRSKIFALLALAIAPAGVFSQSGASAHGTANTLPSRWDIFAGYSYLSPRGSVTTAAPGGGSPITASYDAVNVGGFGGFSYFFNRHIGLQAEVGYHEWGDSKPGSNIGTRGNDDGFLTAGAGVIMRFPVGHITPFIHALGEGARVGGPYYQPNTWGPGVTAGGGLDLETPWLNHHMAIRIAQADYEYMHVNFGTTGFGGVADINAYRLSGGVVFHGGSIAPPTPITLACSISPETIFPGDPVTVSASPGNLNPKDHVVYTWSGTGVSGSDLSPKVDTSSLAPGEYTVTGNVKEGKNGKEGLKPWQAAACTAGLTVKAFEPPTISCTASPSTIKPGDTSTITCQGVSPQNRPLTYSYTATAGTVTGTGPTAAYSSAGAPTGTVGITANVADDKQHSASTTTNLTITAPYVPPAPKTQALCSINFANDARRPTRVDNEAKACLDQIAIDLKQQTDAKAVLVGQQTAAEAAKTAKQQTYAEKHKRATVTQFASQRAVNAKDYLVTEQGIDASRIRLATQTGEGQSVSNYLVPSGANFDTDISGTTPVDESTMKPEARKPLAQSGHRAR